MTTMFADPSTAANSLARTSASPEHHHQQKIVFLPQQQQQVELSSLSPMSPAVNHHHQHQNQTSSSTTTNRQLVMPTDNGDERQPSSSFPRHHNNNTNSLSPQNHQHNQQYSPPIHQTLSNNNNNNNKTNNVALQELQTNLIMQDKIIGTLESDNNRLIQENKSLRQKLKEAEEKAHIAMALNHPSSSGAGSISIPKPASNAVPSSSSATVINMSPETAITIASLKEELAKQREEIDSERRDMTRKISWYIDRQEVSAAQDALVAEQQQQIRDLRLQVADLEAQVMTLGGGSKPLSSASDKDKQIRVLNRRVAELEDAMRNRHPDSLTELIRATRPPLTEAAEFRKMKAQLDEANRRLEDQEQSAQRALSQLRVDSDNLRTQYAKRLEKVEEEMKLRLAATQTRRAKQAEKQTDDIRAYYNKKMKELETELAGYRRGEHNNRNSTGNNGVVVSPHFSMPTSNFTNASNETQQQKKARAASTASSSSASRKNNNNNNHQEENNHNNQSSQQQQHQPQQQMIMTPFGPLPMNANTMMNLMGGHNTNNNNNMMMMHNMMMNQQQQQQNQNHQQSMMPMMVPVMDPSMQQRIWFLETRVKTLEEENRFLQKQASESVLSTGAAAAIQSQLGESHREVITLQRLLREAQEQQRRTLQEIEDRLHNEREAHGKEVERMTTHHRDEMKALQTRCDAEIRLRSDSVTTRQLMAFSSGLSNVLGTDLGANASTKELRRYLLLLAERVHALERQLAATESEHHRQLSELKRVAEFELEVEKQKMGIALKQKNTEIESFKVQLDGMLDQIAKIRK